jgi:DNA-binding response OmpR family regulator
MVLELPEFGFEVAKHILIAEGDKAIQKLPVRVLLREGFDADTVTSGREAIAETEGRLTNV